MVWEFSNADIEGSAPLCFMTGFSILPNRNILADQWLGHGHLGQFDSIFEITRTSASSARYVSQAIKERLRRFIR